MDIALHSIQVETHGVGFFNNIRECPQRPHHLLITNRRDDTATLTLTLPEMTGTVT